MKTKQHTTRWLGLALACGAITLANPAQAGKPVKPPPPPPPVTGLSFTAVNAGNLGDVGMSANAMNNDGVIVGVSVRADYGGYDAFVLEPIDTGSGLIYFVDANADGLNDLIQLLPLTSTASTSWAVDINSSGHIVGGQFDDATQTFNGLIWIDGSFVKIVSRGFARSINDDGIVVGYTDELLLSGSLDRTAFVLVPLDQDNDGIPDTWFSDANADGINDLVMPIAARIPGFVATEVIPDGRVVIKDFNGANPAIVLPDFTDPDGDGNPWFADADFDFYTDLAVSLDPYGEVRPATAAFFSVGHLSNKAVLWDMRGTSVSYINLPNLSSATLRSIAVDANDSQWAVGSSVEKINKKTSKTEYVFWNDGAATVFSAMLPSSEVSDPIPQSVNSAGIVAGNGVVDGENVLFVAFPSEAP